MQDISALSYPVAFAAGFVSFASPCVLALVPGYLTFISGVSFDELGSRTKDVMVPTVAFVLGFSLMFTAYGASAGLVGYSLTRNQDVLNLVAGCLLIATGIAMVAFPRIGLMQTDRRLATARRPTTLVGRGSWARPSRWAGRRASAPSWAASSPTRRPRARRGSARPAVHLLAGARDPVPALGPVPDAHHGHLPLDAGPLDLDINAGAAAVFVAIGFLVATGRFEVITQQLSGVGFNGI